MWFNHPRYIPVRERLVTALAHPSYRFRRLQPVIFLCGGFQSPAREKLRRYFQKTQPELGIFYAERAWEKIASTGLLDALQMEKYLATLADMIIIIVESPGTFTELGAFSVEDSLRKKLLPILHVGFKNEVKSFIATGPVRWIEADSQFSPPIYVKHESILECVPDIEARISSIKRKATHLRDLKGAGRHQVFFLCDLISITYPISIEMLEAYLASILPALGLESVDVLLLVALATAMELVTGLESNGTMYLHPSRLSTITRPYHHVPKVNFASYRAEHFAVLQTIPEAVTILNQIGGLK